MRMLDRLTPAKLWLLLPGLLLLSAGTVLALRGNQQIRTSVSLLTWPTAEATIQECRFRDLSSSDGKEFDVQVRYQYSAGNRIWTGSGIHPVYFSAADEGIGELCARLQKSTVVRIHYNPENPAESWLLTMDHTKSTLQLAAGLLLAVTGFCFVLGGFFAAPVKSSFAQALDVIC